MNGRSVKSRHASASKRKQSKAVHPPAETSGKRDRILQAAIAVFAEHGYFRSRISDIAEKADVADGTVYLYFHNKEEILMAAIDYAFTTFMTSASEEMEKIPDPRQRLRRLAELHLGALGSHRGLATVFQTELRQSARFLMEFSHKRLIEYFDLIRKVIQDGQRSGQFRPQISDKIAANCFFGALDAMVTSWLLSERDYDLAAAATPLVDVILSGLEA
jgi:TetR/AcrR family fatty acid metabolism transcriptional regulator